MVKYEVYPIDTSQDLWEEAMGGKEKFWIDVEPLGRCLLKFPRPNTGETWAEKAVAEIAELLGVPHAEYNLAECGGRRAVLSPEFLDRTCEFYAHGNELLPAIIRDYDAGRTFGQSQHTYQVVIQVLRYLSVLSPECARHLPDSANGDFVFCGYLVLDALVGNTDRHHENWGVIGRNQPSGNLRLPPSYDHASSLGRELQDEKRLDKLNRPNAISSYVLKGRSPFYWCEGDRRGLSPIELVHRASSVDADAFKFWLRRVLALDMQEVSAIFDMFPDGWVSQASVDFALQFVHCSMRILGQIESDISK